MDIKIYKSKIVINEYDLDGGIEYELAVYDKVARQYTEVLFHYNEDERELIIPHGFSDEVLRKYFPDRPIYIMDEYYDEPLPANYTCTSSPRNAYQEESIAFLDKEEHSQKMLCLPTGMGKTFCVINHLAKKKERAMIFVDQASHLMNQWYHEFLNHTDIDESLIFPITSMNDVDTLLEIEPIDLIPFEVYLISHSISRNIIKRDGTGEIFNTLMNRLGIGTKVFDEAHVEWVNTNVVDFMSDTKNTIFLTATPSRSDFQEDAIYQLIYSEVPKFGLQYRNLEDEKYQNLVLVDMDTQPTKDQIKSMNTRRGFDANRHSEYLLTEKKDYVYDVIFDILADLEKKECSKIAIICQKNNFVSDLADELEERLGIKVGRFSSLVDPKVKSEELKYDIIVSTNMSLDKAVDIKGLDGVICLSQYSSSVRARQLVGRIRNPFIEGKEVFYYDVTDVGFPKCKRQRKYRLEALRSKSKNEIELTF